ADGTNQANKLRLDRFVRELEGAINRIVLGKGQAHDDRIMVGRDFVQRLIHKLDNLAKGSVSEGPGNTVSMEHVSSNVEKTAPGQGNQLPAEISETIEQIVESVGAAKKQDGPIPLVQPFSKVKVVDLHSGQRNAKGKNGNSTLSSLEGRGATKATDQNAQPLSLSEKTRMSNEIESRHAVESRPQDGAHDLRLEAGIKETLSNASGPSFSEAAGGVRESERPAARSFLPGYLVEQVGRQIARSLLGGKRVVRLQLRPPELGAVKVEMDIKEDVLRLGMITENSSVKELLLSNAHELKHALVEQGVKLERLDVQINHDSNQSLAYTKEDPGEEQRWIRDADGFLVPEPKTDEDSITGPRSLALSHHVLDVIV
ncbi:MAG: flagellar hook-length control protein FliK, partial [Deltaproteobacteria bacterium]